MDVEGPIVTQHPLHSGTSASTAQWDFSIHCTVGLQHPLQAVALYNLHLHEQQS